MWEGDIYFNGVNGMARVVAVFLVSVLWSGCDTVRAGIGSGSNGEISLQEADPMCGDCVSLEEIAVLGDLEGPGYVEETHLAVRDSSGRYWVAQRHNLKVFTAHGGFVGAVGKLGEGPLEFQYPIPVHTDSAGNVHVLDPGNDRESIINSDFALTEERPLPGPGIYEAVPAPTGHTYVANMWLPTADAIGMPLHLMHGTKVLRSFGAPEGSGIASDNYKIRRRLAIDPAQRKVFSMPKFDYLLEVWSTEGDRIATYSGPELNPHEVKPTFYNRTENPIPNQIIGLQALDSKTLIVISRRPKDDWRDHHVDHVYPRGLVGLRLKQESTMQDVYTTRIEVIDLDAGRIIVRQDRAELLSGFVGTGMLLENRLANDRLTPQIAIWRLTLDVP